jgi:hypothetical protein
MAKNTSEIRVYSDGGIYLAPLETAFPSTISDPIDTLDWAHLGFLSEEGPRVSLGLETTDLMAWQSLYAVRTLATGRPTTIAADLMQWNYHTVEIALGGGEVTEDAPGEYRIEPPAASDVWEKAMMLHTIDGEHNYLWCFPRITREGAVDFAAVRTDSADFTATFKVLDTGDDVPFFLLTDDPAFEDGVVGS